MDGARLCPPQETSEPLTVVPQPHEIEWSEDGSTAVYNGHQYAHRSTLGTLSRYMRETKLNGDGSREVGEWEMVGSGPKCLPIKWMCPDDEYSIMLPHDCRHRVCGRHGKSGCWIREGVARGAARINTARKAWRKVDERYDIAHLIVSPPSWGDDDPGVVWEKQMAWKIAAAVGMIGGSVVIHPWRGTPPRKGHERLWRCDDLTWHYHVVGIARRDQRAFPGWRMRPKGGISELTQSTLDGDDLEGAKADPFVKAGWTWKWPTRINKITRQQPPGHVKNAAKVIRYELSHAGFLDRRHIITWHGALSYAKMKTAQAEIDAEMLMSAVGLIVDELKDCPWCGGRLQPQSKPVPLNAFRRWLQQKLDGVD